ncbi:MAG: AAA family ATPase [Rubrivivax sp.]|nr:AAA family ATPase [Rubrivivax sp.]
MCRRRDATGERAFRVLGAGDVERIDELAVQPRDRRRRRVGHQEARDRARALDGALLAPHVGACERRRRAIEREEARDAVARQGDHVHRGRHGRRSVGSHRRSGGRTRSEGAQRALRHGAATGDQQGHSRGTEPHRVSRRHLADRSAIVSHRALLHQSMTSGDAPGGSPNQCTSVSLDQRFGLPLDERTLMGLRSWLQACRRDRYSSCRAPSQSRARRARHHLADRGRRARAVHGQPMDAVSLLLLALAFVGGAYWGARRSRERGRAPSTSANAEAHAEPPTASAGPGEGPAPQGDPSPLTLDALVERLDAPYEASNRHPTEVTALPEFAAAVALLADTAVPLAKVIEAALDSNPVRAMVAAEALVVREDSPPATQRILGHVRSARIWTLHGLLRFLARRADRPVIWGVLLQAPEYWAENALMPQFVSDFVDARVAQGEPTEAAAAIARRPDFRLQDVRALLARVSSDAAPRLREALDEWERTRVDAAFLRQIGRLGSATDLAAADPAATDDPVIVHAALEQATRSVLDDLAAAPPKSVVLVGETGVGKSAIARRAAAELRQRGWTIFEAGAADILAGQAYMGELEKRLRELVEQIDVARKVVWLIPGFHELAQAGRHRYSTTSVLDLVMAAIESGRIVVLGESAPAPMETVLKQRPRLRFAMSIVKVEALGPEATLALAREVVASEVLPSGLEADAEVAGDALELARNYLTASAMPGSTIGLLRQTRQRVLAAGGRRFSRDDVLATVASVTGLPRAVLDERAGLAPASLRQLFAQRVMGQPEAVSCLVDRIAMLKAGLVDPRRPIGVFLFAGPTGTGKTEVAKTLASFLFGGAERMLRLDMSEFQEPTALARLVGEPGDDGTVESLVHQIRKQPFSVILLDEFEKAHPRVWDLFLQVFDDGRLTDANGQVADFRHAIIILTSNAGATTHQSGSLGFTSSGGAFSEAQVTRALSGFFRPEFINRIDRVVVFRPLSKAVMRDILKKELGDVLKRRGFRNRDWAVEWEPSAIDFLLDRGFTTDMGARPLRRAVEEHLLAPLAMTIVENRFPEGDQFLFVRSDGNGIQVEFIDPDAPAITTDQPAAQAVAVDSEPAAELALGRLVLAPRGDGEARRFLVARAAALVERVADAGWRGQKDALLESINREGFWSTEDRFSTLDRMERMDRIAAEAEALRSLVRRLEAGRAPAASVVGGVAQRLHLLAAALADLDAGWPGDAYVAVDAVANEGDATRGAAWARRLGRMYREWAKRRGLRLVTLEDGTDGGTLLAVSGLGVRTLLSREAGLHVFEAPDGRDSFDRAAARVRVVPQPVEPLARPQKEREVALQCLSAAPPASTVVRRYREEPSPLVRDAVSGWRTGRLPDVLDGGFDLFEPV